MSTAHVNGRENGLRIESRVVEERLQEAVKSGATVIEVDAYGQHGLGGRLPQSLKTPILVKVRGASGQRLGSLGFPGTTIEVFGPASDDVGWLNAGAEIIVHGEAGNGACNAMGQGKVFVGGSIGARGMTMTKQNPRFPAPELWVLGSVGDYFAEFMAGGVAVVCGIDPKDPENVLGFRPCVGMVGGRIYLHGPHQGFSQADAVFEPIDDAAWTWLQAGVKDFLDRVKRPELLSTLADRETWQCIRARTPMEKGGRKRRSMKAYHAEVWDKELGRGGLIGDLTDLDRSLIPVIFNGIMRRFVPVWEHKKYASPCQAQCPTGIPVQERWSLIREGKVDEAVDLALAYTPFPASICGYLCPNLCMQGCTRQTAGSLEPVNIPALGKASIQSKFKKEDLPPLSGRKVAIIGGGPAGVSAAWRLRSLGHEGVVYDLDSVLGGKMSSAIPESRIPKDVLDAELTRLREVIPHVHLSQPMSRDEFEQLKNDHDFVIVAAGASKPRKIPVPGADLAPTSLDFLRDAKKNKAKVGKRVVIIGAGNVGCDVAVEAHRLGAESITLIDIQEPAAFGKERKHAEEAGAQFKFPCFTKEITPKGVLLTDGELVPADTVVFAVGDSPDVAFLPETVALERGFVKVDEFFRTTDSKVFAVGDVVKIGLLTEAVGAGRKAAGFIDDVFQGKRPQSDTTKMIEYDRMQLAYFDPRMTQSDMEDLEHCSHQCASCGSCRDCGLCEQLCPTGAITRIEGKTKKDYERVVNADKCIGCGFCAGTCPCGVWDLVENTPIG